MRSTVVRILVVLTISLHALAEDSVIKLASEVDALLTARAAAREFSGVCLVAKDGKPVVRGAWGHADWLDETAATAETPFLIFSTSKQFTAALIMRLREKKILSIDDEAGAHLEHWPAEWNGVKIRHLLSHSSGIDRDMLYFWLIRHQPRFWDGPASEMPAYQPTPLVTTPGSTFLYSNSGFIVLTVIAENATGKPFPELMQSEVFGPVGMKDTWLEWTDRDRSRARGHSLRDGKVERSEQTTHHIAGAGDVATTLDDLLRWDEALYGDAFLSEASKRAMFTSHVESDDVDWGYGWMIEEREGRETLYMHSGLGAGFRSVVYRLPRSHLYVAVLGNLPSAAASAAAREVLEKAEVALGD